MYLSEFQLYSYKSYQDSGPIKLKPGFNILTGQNNAGKTALLEGLSLQFADKRHRSLTTAPTSTRSNSKTSQARFCITVEQAELINALKERPGRLVVPIPVPGHPDTQGPLLSFDLILKQSEIQFELIKSAEGPISPAHRASFNLYDSKQEWISIKWDKNDQAQVQLASSPGNNSTQELGVGLAQQFLSRIYSFRAERMNIGVSPFGPNRELASDAHNLPEVLNTLQSNPARFERYNQLVKRVLPQVERITVRPLAGHKVEILVWSEDPRLEREDLAIPLSESGTGISQVLSMLYVLVTAEFSRVIIIDEPNSFLHPGAVRSLVEIFREHPQHQYIISTHSPEFIAASNPSTIHILRKKGSTVVERVDAQETQQLRALLMEVGSRLSDVFGADKILWVEGKTEEICFPLIVQKFLRRPLSGVSIVGVLHTGDFDSEDAQAAFRIYEKLTQGKALLPPAIAFIFDRELRPEKDRIDLIRLSNKRVSFLSRRTYENYLLRPEAIATVLNKQPSFQEAPIHVTKVQDWLQAHSTDEKYYRKAKTRSFPEDVDAPKLLSDLFSELSGNTLAYNKVQHSLALTEWILENAPGQLQEIADILAAKLNADLAKAP